MTSATNLVDCTATATLAPENFCIALASTIAKTTRIILCTKLGTVKVQKPLSITTIMSTLKTIKVAADPPENVFFFHDGVAVCTSAQCTPNNPGSFGDDHHRACPNLLNKNKRCASNDDCTSADDVKGGNGFCPKEGSNWRNCYEDFLCCATKDGLDQYGNLSPDEFGGDCVADCSTAYKCTNGQIWSLMDNKCVDDASPTRRERRFLNIKSKTDDTVQTNLNKAKTTGFLEGSNPAAGNDVTSTTGEGSSSTIFCWLFVFLMGLFA